MPLYSPATTSGASLQDISNAISDHEAAADPHPQYLTQAEADGLYGAGAGIMNHVQKTANYNAVVNDFVECDTTAGGFTVTLPSLATCTAGDQITVVLVLGTNNLIVDGNGSDQINRNANYILNFPEEGYTFVVNADLSQWLIT